jgi:hypothetical protein
MIPPMRAREMHTNTSMIQKKIYTCSYFRTLVQIAIPMILCLDLDTLFKLQSCEQDFDCVFIAWSSCCGLRHICKIGRSFYS